MELAKLEAKTKDELQEMAEQLGVESASRLRKHDLALRILRAKAEEEGLTFFEGVLEVSPDGTEGFIRTNGYLQNVDRDVYVAQSQIRRFNLKTGDTIAGPVRPPKENERYYSLLRVEALNTQDPERGRHRVEFESLTPIYPNQRLRLEVAHEDTAARFMDIITPIGKGQRGLIIAPPKAGKTTLIKQIANSVTTNNPEVTLLVLLIDERPEEVTDIERSVDGEVVASTFDELPENHMKVAELVLARAKRLVEHGVDVVILLDSITRLARASNLTVNPSGRTLSGGLDPTALYRPKRFFGAARNIEEGGSLTVLATILIETGSRMDDMIYEEFKATGNLDLRLTRDLADKGVFPAIDIQQSSTRHQELLFDDDEMRQIWQLRRALAAMSAEDATELLISGLRKTKTNKEFLTMAENTFRT